MLFYEWFSTHTSSVTVSSRTVLHVIWDNLFAVSGRKVLFTSVEAMSSRLGVPLFHLFLRARCSRQTWKGRYHEIESIDQIIADGYRSVAANVNLHQVPTWKLAHDILLLGLKPSSLLMWLTSAERTTSTQSTNALHGLKQVSSQENQWIIKLKH